MFVEVDGIIFGGGFSGIIKGKGEITIPLGPCSILSQLGYDTRQLDEGSFRGILPNVDDLVAI